MQDQPIAVAVARRSWDADSTNHFDLKVELAQCGRRPARRATPEIGCRWSVGAPMPMSEPLLSGETAWIGLSGVVRVDVPRLTGKYRLSLRCDIEGSGPQKPIDRTLFVTYDKPMQSVSPPEKDWYERATSWGAGFAAGASEADIMQQLLEGIWDYAHAKKWKYGSFHKPHQPYSKAPDCPNDDDLPVRWQESSWYYCCWNNLIKDNSKCRYADCYQFTHALDVVAKTLGIAGTTIRILEGTSYYGFLVKPGAQSLDPLFRGNVVNCRMEENPRCPSYSFSSHMILERSGIYYDATFGNIYNFPTEPIALWADKQLGGDKKPTYRTFRFSNAILCKGPRGYGSWYQYVYDESGACADHTVIDLRPPGDLPILSKLTGKFTGKVDFEPVDQNADGLYESLKAIVEVELPERGEFFVNGLLLDGEEVIANRPVWTATRFSTVTVSSEGAGTQTLTLHFSGEQIYRYGADGPYSLQLYMERDSGLDDLVALHSQITVETPELSFESFGEIGATIEDMRAETVSDESSGEYTGLKLILEVKVRAADNYLAEGALIKDHHTLARAQKELILEPGLHTFEHTIPGEELARAGIDSPYLLTMELHDGNKYPIDGTSVSIEGLESDLFAP